MYVFGIFFLFFEIKTFVVLFAGYPLIANYEKNIQKKER